MRVKQPSQAFSVILSARSFVGAARGTSVLIAAYRESRWEQTPGVELSAHRVSVRKLINPSAWTSRGRVR